MSCGQPPTQVTHPSFCSTFSRRSGAHALHLLTNLEGMTDPWKFRRDWGTVGWWFRNPQGQPPGDVKTFVNNGINYLSLNWWVGQISEPSTVWSWWEKTSTKWFSSIFFAPETWAQATSLPCGSQHRHPESRKSDDLHHLDILRLPCYDSQFLRTFVWLTSG